MQHSKAQVRYQSFRFALALQVLLIFHRVQHEIYVRQAIHKIDAKHPWHGPSPEYGQGIGPIKGGYINHHNPVISVTLQGTNISHLAKRKIILKMPFLGDMLVPWRV